MAIKFNRSQTFATNGTVTAAGLHNLIDGTDIYQALITDQTNLTSVGSADELLIADADLTANDAPRAVTVNELFQDALTISTYTNANLTNISYGTSTGTRLVSTNASITTGTIPSLTAGTTTSTAATIPTLTAGTTTSTAANITNGTIQTLTSSTATITGGTFSGSVNSTSGTIGTLNTTTGTISNLSTTLAGDFTISQGTGTIGTGTITAAKLANPQYTGFRNRIINGDMRIDQRNAGASVTPSNGAYTLDRWASFRSGGGVWTVQRSTTAPSTFTNSLAVTVTTQDSSIASTDYYLLQHILEGFNTSDFAWGTASASSVTLSFWVRSSVTGTFGGSIGNGAGGRSYPFSYSISSANTWEKKTITISGDTSGTWATDNSGSLTINIDLGSGTSRKGTAGSWSSSDLTTATGTTQLISTNGATFYITGVQLEAGSTATDFEVRPYGTELALCQRYFYHSGGTGNANGYAAVATGNVSGTTQAELLVPLPTPMRATPTASFNGTVTVYDGTARNLSGVGSVYDTSTKNSIYIAVNVSSGLTVGRGVLLYTGNLSSDYIRFSSEL